MAERIEPERSDASAWIPWIAAVVVVLALSLISTIHVRGMGDEGWLWWILGGVGALLAATLLLPAWAIFGTRR